MYTMCFFCQALKCAGCGGLWLRGQRSCHMCGYPDMFEKEKVK